MAENFNIKLSVIIPTYNYAHYIEAAINSVLTQKYKTHEIIIVDDGSTDNTKSVVNSICETHSQPNIYYYYQENKGVSAARNYGYQKTSGDYILFLDADDRLLTDTFEYIKSAVNLNINADMIFGGYRSISVKGKKREQRPEQLSDDKLSNVYKLLEGKMLGLRPSSTILKRNVMDTFKFSEKIHVGEDTIFFAQVFYKFNCVSIPEIFVEMPRHEDSLRENYQRIVETGTEGINELFETLPVNKDMNALKERMLIQSHLKIARKAYLSSQYKTAAQNYNQAFKLKPTSILKLKHFPRTIMSMVKS